MDGFRTWAAVVCTAAVVCSVMRQLFPDTTLGRQGRLVLPCVFLCTLLVPLPRVMQGVKLPDFTGGIAVDEAGLRMQMYEQVTKQVEDGLLAMVNQALAGYGWQVKKVGVKMDIGEDGGISMGQITLYLDEATARHSVAVQQVAEKRLGTSVVTAVWEEAP